MAAAKNILPGIFCALCYSVFGDAKIGAKDFLERALMLGILEIEAGKLAQKRSTTEDVKKFAKMAIERHTNINEELTRLANQKGIKSVFDAGLIVDARKATFEQYDAQTFDELYVKIRIKAYERMIRLLHRASLSKDNEIVMFVHEALPIFLSFLGEARELDDATLVDND